MDNLIKSYIQSQKAIWDKIYNDALTEEEWKPIGEKITELLQKNVGKQDILKFLTDEPNEEFKEFITKDFHDEIEIKDITPKIEEALNNSVKENSPVKENRPKSEEVLKNSVKENRLNNSVKEKKTIINGPVYDEIKIKKIERPYVKELFLMIFVFAILIVFFEIEWLSYVFWIFSSICSYAIIRENNLSWKMMLLYVLTGPIYLSFYVTGMDSFYSF